MSTLCLFHHIAGTLSLELRVSGFQENQQLFHHRLDVLGVDQREAQLHGPLLDGHICVLQALEDCGSVSLDCVVVHVDSFQEGVQSHVADVLVAVEKEPAKDVNCQHTESGLAVNVHDGENSLVEDCVSNVFTSLCICCNLKKYWYF